MEFLTVQDGSGSKFQVPFLVRSVRYQERSNATAAAVRARYLRDESLDRLMLQLRRFAHEARA